MIMMGHRGTKKGGDEWDALTSGKRYLGWAPSERKKIKRKYNKRMRKLAKAECWKLMER